MKECPFCRGLAVLKRDITSTRDGTDINKFTVRCRKCGAEGPWAATAPKAIDLWNKRVGDPSEPAVEDVHASGVLPTASGQTTEAPR